MSWQRASTTGPPPTDPVGEAVAAAIAETVEGASVELVYSPDGAPLPRVPKGPLVASAAGPGPVGWNVTLTVRLGGRIGPLVGGSAALLEVMNAVPEAGVRTLARFSNLRGGNGAPLAAAMRRALRDTVVVEALSRHHSCGPDCAALTGLIAETVEYLVELGGTRVESHDLTHGVVVTDALRDTPRLHFAYPDDLRTVKRAPLLFDGQRSVLVVDRQGRARTELQRHRFDRLTPGEAALGPFAAEFADSGAMVAAATRRLGGIGFFLRADRTIWTFADGDPLLVRRGEHWTAFPLELAASVADTIGGSTGTADIVVQAAFIISAQRHGAILAVVDDAGSLDGIVSLKDRYDLRNDADPMAMQPETRLHHLIDAEKVDAQTLARLAALDGATILDRDANLLAYGAIVTSADSEHEGARTAAAKTLSHTADVVLNVSADGGITVFRDGIAVAALLH